MLNLNNKDAQTVLEQYAMRLPGSDAVYYVHYWGITPEHFSNPVHKHSFFEICYVLSGEGTYMDEGIDYPLSTGTLFCSRPGIWHQIRSDTGMFLLFVAFEVVESESQPEAVQRFQQLVRTRKFYIADAEDSSTALLWKALIQLAGGQPMMPELVTSLSHALISSFYPTFTDVLSVKKEPLPQKSPSATHLYRAKLFIRDNLAQPLKLEDVAEYLHITPRHLSRLFAIELRQSFSAYIRRERIKHAVQLLETTELTIKQIAQETGFDSVHYFTRVFSSETGTPPGKYRGQTLLPPP